MSAATIRNAVTLAVVAQLILALYLGSLLKAQPAHAVSSPETFGTTTNQVLSLTQLTAAALFLVAAFALARVADDRLTATFAVAAVLAGISRVNFAVALSPSSEHVLTAEAFRLGFHAVLLTGAVYEIRRYWQKAGEAAVLEERRRIARELHDGMAQELSFVVSQSRHLGSASGQVVAAAAERALDESRRAIAALTRPLDEPFELQLTQTAEEVAGRLGARVQFRIEPGIAVEADKREALLRIAREAVTNAARHGNADRILVVVSNHHGVQLQVVDNGTGFDPADRRHLSGRFGLISMRERCEALRGSFSVVSAPNRGTTVRAWVP